MVVVGGNRYGREAGSTMPDSQLEVVEETKLIIFMYSQVCYFCFYQERIRYYFCTGIKLSVRKMSLKSFDLHGDVNDKQAKIKCYLTKSYLLYLIEIYIYIVRKTMFSPNLVSNPQRHVTFSGSQGLVG